MKSKTFHALLMLLISTALSHAMPFNTATLDGLPTEYTSDDLRGSFVGAATWGQENVITNLYITWDDTYLYVALQGWEADNKLVVMLDVDPGAGTGATTTTNWVSVPPAHIQYNCVGWQAFDQTGADFGLDFMLASEGFFNDVLHILYDGTDTPDTNNVIALFSSGNGNTPVGSEVDMVVQADGTACDLKGFEARIPWTTLYPDDGRHGTVSPGDAVPTGATIRVFANLHNNAPDFSYSSPDTIPAQIGNADYDAGLLTTDTYIEIVIDQDEDGMPDNPSLGLNPPFLRAVLGKEGGDVVYARFNKAVTAATATNTVNWWVDGANPYFVTNIAPDTVLLYVLDPLPAGLIEVLADGVEDANALSKETYLCLSPSADGLDDPLTVRFVLDVNSGMGPAGAPLAHGASAYFINGDAPFDWGYPPSMTTPITNVLSGSLRYRDVVFPPGSPLTINYKFSALLTGTGTNNYEAVRLDNYLTATRVLTLDPDVPGGVMFVTNRLGAAAGPLRAADEDGYEALYLDARRSHAGVDQRYLITFRLDLSAYDVGAIDRVFIQGTDPLRGFNFDGGASDWLGGPPVPSFQDSAGILMTNSGAGVFARTWAWTPTGFDSTAEPEFPYSLVSGGDFTPPWYGSGWADGRSPRSFKYQFYLISEFGEVLNSPGSDIEFYIEPGQSTNIVLDIAMWEGTNPDDPPDPTVLPDPTNAPIVVALGPGPSSLTLFYTNAPNQRLHLVDVSDDLLGGWRHYGQVVRPYVSDGSETVAMQNDDVLFARIRAARENPYRGLQITPNPLPDTGGTARIYFYQTGTPMAGDRAVQIVGSFNGWSAAPMTFAGNGTWYHDVVVSEIMGTQEFKIRDGALTLWYAAWGIPNDGNYPIYKGDHHATWVPMEPEPGEVLTVTYDAAGGPLAAAASIFAHRGFDELWSETEALPMTNTVDTLWEVAFPVPTNYLTSVNFVFNNGAGTWHSETAGGGRAWRAFIGPIGE